MLGHEDLPRSRSFRALLPGRSLYLPWVLDEPAEGPNSPDTKET